MAREATLFAAIGMFVGGIDDLLVDSIFLIKRVTGWWRGERTPTLADMRPSGKRLAIFIPAWDEAAVIGAMLATLSQRVASATLTVFVGTYPNDPATIAAVTRMADLDPRIRLVVGSAPGPTTKADCLNSIWRALLAEEAASGTPFDAIVLHDAEDVVHPAEIAVIDHYLDEFAAVQLPVIPLPHDDAPLVGGTYLDEFADAHGRTLVVRGAIGAGLPFAGVGCAIARPVLERIAAARDGDPFDADSLTEDYELGLTVAAMGGRTRFARVLERPGGPLIGVRAYFPKNFDAATRQKARWMLGIALAGWDRTGWGRTRHIGEWWMRMRDRRAPIAAIVLLAAYLALVLAAVQFVFGLPNPEPSPEMFALLGVTTALLLIRIVVRAAFVWRLYGVAEALRSVPRMLIGNIVAMASARLAVLRYIRMLRGTPLHWDKTIHQFPEAVPPV
ncbi:glycosyl transferase family protein [Sphingomonas floccifaciens]|uniref:glycosyl transferase family protein n=1 Tax=Sphingomonas floccifaciens TaxID=1844115 RepID=UPI0036D2E922